MILNSVRWSLKKIDTGIVVNVEGKLQAQKNQKKHLYWHVCRLGDMPFRLENYFRQSFFIEPWRLSRALLKRFLWRKSR